MNYKKKKTKNRLTGYSAFDGENYAEMMAANKKAEINYDFKKMGCKISSLGRITFFC